MVYLTCFVRDQLICKWTRVDCGRFADDNIATSNI